MNTCMAMWCVPYLCPGIHMRQHINVAWPSDACNHTRIGRWWLSFSCPVLIYVRQSMWDHAPHDMRIGRNAFSLVLVCLHTQSGLEFGLVAFLFVSKTFQTHKILSKSSNDPRNTLKSENSVNACIWYLNHSKLLLSADNSQEFTVKVMINIAKVVTNQSFTTVGKGISSWVMNHGNVECGRMCPLYLHEMVTVKKSQYRVTYHHDCRKHHSKVKRLRGSIPSASTLRDFKMFQHDWLFQP